MLLEQDMTTLPEHLTSTFLNLMCSVLFGVEHYFSFGFFILVIGMMFFTN
jgi:hypothetical protein